MEVPCYQPPMRFLNNLFLFSALLLGGCKNLPKLSGLNFLKKADTGETDKDRSKRETAESAFLAECRKLGESGSSVKGTDGWLFTGAELKRLGATPEVGSNTFASAVNAISEYRRQLKAEGVELVVAVIPPKAIVFPDKLSKDLKVPVKKGAPPALDGYYTGATEALRKKGIKVVYPTEDFLSQRTAKAGSLFVKGSAYPTPQAARRLAQAIAETSGLSHGSAGFIAKEAAVDGGADLGGKAEKLPVRQVFRPDGTTSIPLGDTGLSVLVIADDSVRQWRAENASLPEQLSFELQRPIGILTGPNARNSQRQKLMSLGTTGKNPFASTKLVVWIFQATDLTSPDWATIPLRLNFKMADPTIRTN